MNRVYLQLVFTALSLISLMITCNKCQRRQQQQAALQAAQQTWGPELDKQMYDVFYTQSATFSTNENFKKEYAGCCLEKMKQIFPNGISEIDTRMNDSVKIAIMKMGVECSKNLKNSINIWQPEVVQQLKLQFYSYPEIKLLPQRLKKEYVDCLAFKVVTTFPNGVGDKSNKDTLKKVIEKARKACLTLLANKYPRHKKDTIAN